MRGRLGEDLAASYLLLRGFTILERNAREGPRELDLIASIPGWFVVVEVRLRADAERGLPEQSIQWRKRQQLRRAAEARWLRQGRDYGPLRMDMISVLLTPDGLRLRHYPHFMVPAATR